MAKHRIAREEGPQIPTKERSNAPEKQKIGVAKKRQTYELKIYKNIKLFWDSTPQSDH